LEQSRSFTQVQLLNEKQGDPGTPGTDRVNAELNVVYSRT
jgi:hypothetical protein